MSGRCRSELRRSLTAHGRYVSVEQEVSFYQGARDCSRHAIRGNCRDLQRNCAASGWTIRFLLRGLTPLDPVFWNQRLSENLSGIFARSLKNKDLELKSLFSFDLEPTSAAGWGTGDGRFCFVPALDAHFVPIEKSSLTKARPRKEPLLQAARRDKRYATSSIAAHPCKERKDGAPTFRYGQGRTEHGQGWASPRRKERDV
jgi:hypothetical protein